MQMESSNTMRVLFTSCCFGLFLSIWNLYCNEFTNVSSHTPKQWIATSRHVSITKWPSSVLYYSQRWTLGDWNTCSGVDRTVPVVQFFLHNHQTRDHVFRNILSFHQTWKDKFNPFILGVSLCFRFMWCSAFGGTRNLMKKN